MLFRVKAARGGAEIVSLAIEAFDAQNATCLVRERGYDVVTVRRTGPNWPRRSGTGGFGVLLLTQELVALLDAGLNLVAAIEALAEKEGSAEVRHVLDRIVERLHRGAPLSDALQEFPHLFSPLYVATVRSNEKSGGLVEALTRYARYRAQIDQVRSKLVSALIYPALLLVAGSAVALFLLFYVVPKFRRVFEDMGTALPLFSRMLVAWGRAVESHGALIALAAAVLIAGAAVLLSRPAVRRALMARFLALPAVGERFRMYQYARFYRTLGMLQRSGIPLATALQIAATLLSEALKPAMEKARQAVREGTAFSQAMEENRLTTPIAYRLLRVGEQSGEMPDMLERIASFHEEQLARWVEWFSRLFEPLLMAAIGVVIGLIVIFLYMPIFELAGSIQ